MLLGFTNGHVLLSDVVFILGYTDGEVRGYTATVLDSFIVVIDEGNGMGSLIESTDGSNEENTGVSMLGESLESDDGSEPCSSCGF